MIVDGTSMPMFRGDVGIRDGKIAEIGDLQSENAETVIDAEGRYVTPGFIDVNNHSDTYWQIFSNPHLESLLFQGITTIVGGNCGSSLAPLMNASMLASIQKWTDIGKVNLNWLSMQEFLEQVKKQRLSVNFATLIGHSTLRRGLVGDESRALDSNELSTLESMMKKGMKEGAFGCSLGLEYVHSRSASKEELESIARVVKKEHGILSVHLRDESIHFLDAIREVIRISKNTGCAVHIVHFKVTGELHWDEMDKALELLADAKKEGIAVSFDVYPYTITGTVLYTLLPHWVTEGGKRSILEKLKDGETRKEIILELKEKKRDYSKVVILASSMNQMLTHQSIAEMAVYQGVQPEEALIDILIASDCRAISSMEVVSEQNIEKEILHPLSVISTNGSGYSVTHETVGEIVHPRNFGTFPKVLTQYVRDQKLLSIEDAIHKMTHKPAELLGFQKRGTLKKGNYADILVFNLNTMQAEATLESPFIYARGMEHVFINGKLAIHNGEYVDVRSGEILTKKSSSWLS